MKILCTITILLGSVSLLFSQGEGLSPLGVNSSILGPVPMKAGPETFDSTFIYASDTLEVSLTKSFLDEFTKDHFQKYVPDFTNPEITSDKRYKLLDNNTSVPLPVTARYSNTPTVRRIVNVGAGTVVNQPLTPDTIRVSLFLVYPPVYETQVVYPPYDIVDTVDFANDSDTIFQPMPFFVQDSATQFFANLHDPNAYWLDSYAYHNYRFARDPWTLGVVTFDGLDDNGYPYNINSSASGYADVLTSKPIDMSSLSAVNEVYFSFLYQKEGLGDIPEESDSLVLEFYAPEINQWFRVWSVNGGPVTDFQRKHIKVQDPKYFKSAFQFRFKNYGGLSGSLDHFHIDYVHLRASSGPQDTLFKDFAFVYPIGSLLKDYTSVPWEHYQNNPLNKMSDSVKIVVRNGSNITENSQDGLAWVQYAGATEGSFVLLDTKLTGSGLANYAPFSFFTSYHDFSGGYRYDENKPGDEQVFDIFATATAPFSHLSVNDSTSNKQVFSNYYAYDDGTAEQAYGTVGIQSMLAYQFTPYEADSLIGVQMHFVPTVDDVSDHMFLLTVWDDNGGKPGNVIYEDDFFYPRNPHYESERNKFTNYYLKDTAKLAITGTFYVGWRQLEGEKLGIGFDRNNVNSDKIFYSITNGNTWPKSTLPGSLMMRPIFSTALDASLGVKELEKTANTFEVYPNPVNNIIHLRTNAVVNKGAVLFDIQGKVILEIEPGQTEADLSALNPGIYIIRDIHSGIARKIIKN